MKLLIVTILFVFTLSATEVDQFTKREVYVKTLGDYSYTLNRMTETYFDKAVESYNEKHCGNFYTKSAANRLFAFEIWNEIAAEKRKRKEPRAASHVSWTHAYHKVGKGPLQKDLIADVPRGSIIKNEHDVFEFIKLFSVTYLMKIGDVMLGLDKIDHFFDQGYEYYLASEYGKYDDRAIEFGQSGEAGWYGMIVSGVFSYSDLKANYDGYMFYKSLFDVDSVFHLDPYSCVSQKKFFNWKEIIDWEYDELLNGSIYSQRTNRIIIDYLKKNLEALNYCKSYRYALENDLFGRGVKRNSYYYNFSPEGFVNPFQVGLSGLCK